MWPLISLSAQSSHPARRLAAACPDIEKCRILFFFFYDDCCMIFWYFSSPVVCMWYDFIRSENCLAQLLQLLCPATARPCMQLCMQVRTSVWPTVIIITRGAGPKMCSLEFLLLPRRQAAAAQPSPRLQGPPRDVFCFIMQGSHGHISSIHN